MLIIYVRLHKHERVESKNRSILIQDGGMAEWSKAAVLKTVEVHASVGSNPTPSANKTVTQFLGEMAELAEGARLLSEYGGYTPSWVRITFSPPLYKN